MDTRRDSTAARAPQARAGAAAAADRHLTPSTRLRGRRLLVARVAWATAATAQLQTVCGGARCALVQPTSDSARTLHQLGFSLGGYAALTFALILLSSVICFAVSGVIVWRKSDDWMALLVALSAVAESTVLVSYLLETGRSTWQLLALVVSALDFVLLFLVFALFPSGRFVPRWTRWLVVGWLAASVALVVSYLLTGELRFTAYALVWLAALAGVGGAQVYRYRSVSGPRERAQTRWVVFGVSSAIAVVFALETPTFFFAALGRPGSFYRLATGPIYSLPSVLFSVSIGVSILRNRLYDIDVIIHRTLIYVLLTGMLAAVYFGSVVLLQAGFRALTGQGSPVAVVISTLAIAALFQPVRGWVQAAIDRRFYRRKYDAARTLAAFSASLRSEVDLTQLSDQLMGVVEATMQPAHVSLWLTSPQPSGDLGPPQAEQGREERADTPG
jgi:hypothetical protein